jgi:hypothetical protein
MRRKTILLITTVGIVAALALNGAASPPPANPVESVRDLARALLGHANVRMTAAANTGLRTVASGSHALNPGDQGINPDAAQVPTGGLSARKTPATLPNVRVNDPAADTHGEDQTTQSETAVAVSGSHVAVAYNDSQHTGLFLTAGSSLSGYSYSSDGGAHFADGGSLPNRDGFVNGGDPALAADRGGNMYYGNLLFGVLSLEVGVAKSTDGGATWSPPVPVQPPPPLSQFSMGDKDAITVGPDPSSPAQDNVYAAWDDFVFTRNQFLTGLPVSHSYDGGKTWNLVYADRIDNSQGCSFGQYFGAQPLVDPSDGTLYVAAEKISANDPKCQGASTVFSEVIVKSTDGGQTFGPVVKIADLTSSTLSTPGLSLGPGKIMRLADFPTIALLGNALYVAWNEREGSNTHLTIAKSTNGGRSWSVGHPISGFGDEVQPALSADSSGLHLMYYERNSNKTLDVYVANSPDGSSFTPRLVTTQPSPGALTFPQFDPIIAFGYMGDYIANVSDGNHQYFAWGDNRDTVTDFLYPSGRADPNVYFAKQ